MRSAMITASILCFAALVSPGAAQSPRSFDEAVGAYRAGRFDEAVGVVYERSGGNDFDDALDRWLDKPEPDRHHLEAAFMLQTEVVLATWRAIVIGEWVRWSARVQTQLRRLRRLHDVLASMDRPSPFMRTWYLLWESFAQGNDPHRTTQDEEYTSTALRLFPNDAELLLSAASCLEMRWWGALDNPRRHPTGASGGATPLLRMARDQLRKSVVAEGAPQEAHLRLGRVLMLGGDLDGGIAQLRPLRSDAADRNVRYLATLFLGEAYLRRGDLDAAEREYHAATQLVPFAQSAWLGSARIAHVRGESKSAVDAVLRTLADRSDESDPWWFYVRGQWTHFDRLLTAARNAVQSTP